MEIGKPINISALDWDDTELIKAYDRGMKLTKKGMSKSKDNKEISNKEKRNEKKWMLGDYCRAPYTDDGLMYEARIISMYDDACTVEYLGYEGDDEVLLSQLEESAGKNARRKQKKRADGNGYITSDSERSSVSNVRALREEVEYLRNKINQPPQDVHESPRPNPSNYQQPSAHSSYCQPPPHPYYNPTTAIQRVEDAMPPPPAPPMPQCPTIARDPALSAMLVSWYMAGYYTGLHQNQRSSHCSMAPKHCCDYHDTPSCFRR